MNVEKYLPLTETTFYILIALKDPGHGYYVMQKVEELSNGKVRVAPGTMYGAIENLLKLDWIEAVSNVEKQRKKVYQITSCGRAILKQETQRLKSLIRLAEQFELS